MIFISKTLSWKRFHQRKEEEIWEKLNFPLKSFARNMNWYSTLNTLQQWWNFTPTLFQQMDNLGSLKEFRNWIQLAFHSLILYQQLGMIKFISWFEHHIFCLQRFFRLTLIHLFQLQVKTPKTDAIFGNWLTNQILMNRS